MKPLRDWDLSCRINLTLLLLMLAAGGIGGGFLFREVSGLLDEEINRSAQAAVMAAAERINRNFPVVEAAAQELALSLELLNPGEDAQAELLGRSFESLRRPVPALCGVGIARLPGGEPGGAPPMLYAYPSAEGKLRTVRVSDAEYRWLESDWFRIPQLLDRAVWTEPYRSRYTGVLMCTRAQPIRDAAGKFRGLAVFNLSLEDLNAEVARADAYGYGQEFLISRFGRFVAFPEDLARPQEMRDEAAALLQSTIFSYADLLRERTFTRNDAADQLRRLGRAMLAGESGELRGRIFNREAGLERIFYAPLPNPGWSLGVAYPEKLLTAPLHALSERLVLIALLALLTGLLAAWILVRRMTRPLGELADAAQSIGEGNFNTPLPEAKGRDQIGRLTEAFQGMQRALAEYLERFKTSTAERERFEKELEVAREIQFGMLPETPLPSACGFTLFAELRPARRVGGDLYDFFRLDDQHCCFTVGDVSGEGIQAALFMAVVQMLQRGEAEKSRDPGAIVNGINRFLSTGNATRASVNYLLGILDMRTGVIRYTNADLNPPCVRRAGGALELLTARHGPALGTDPGAQYASGSVTLAAGDTLVLYTDGVTTTLDSAGKVFGSDALLRVVAYRPESSPADLGARILEAIGRFAGRAEQPDDIALLILRFNGPRDKGVSIDG